MTLLLSSSPLPHKKYRHPLVNLDLKPPKETSRKRTAMLERAQGRVEGQSLSPGVLRP